MPHVDALAPRSLADLEPHQRRRRALHSAIRIGIVLGLMLTAYGLSPASGADSSEIVTRVIVSLTIVGCAVALSVRSVMRAEFPTLRAIEAMAAVVGLLIIVFAYSYLVASGNDAGSFSEPLDHVGALYFTITTVTTVGFGDISPKSDAARVVVMIQMVCNVVVIGAVARLLLGVARHRAGRS